MGRPSLLLRPARAVTKQFSGVQKPVRVLSLRDDQGPGVVELRSPDAWARWRIETVCDGETRFQYAETGPASVAVVPVAAGFSIECCPVRLLGSDEARVLPNGVFDWDWQSSGGPPPTSQTTDDPSPITGHAASPKATAWFWPRGTADLDDLIKGQADWAWAGGGVHDGGDDYERNPVGVDPEWWCWPAEFPLYILPGVTFLLGATPGTANRARMIADGPLTPSVSCRAESVPQLVLPGAQQVTFAVRPWSLIAVKNYTNTKLTFAMLFDREG